MKAYTKPTIRHLLALMPLCSETPINKHQAEAAVRSPRVRSPRETIGRLLREGLLQVTFLWIGDVATEGYLLSEKGKALADMYGRWAV